MLIFSYQWSSQSIGDSIRDAIRNLYSGIDNALGIDDAVKKLTFCSAVWVASCYRIEVNTTGWRYRMSAGFVAPGICFTVAL
jgi:hypothetical protein